MEVSDCLFSQDDQTVLLFVDVLDAWYYTYFIYDVIVTESVPYYFFACILFHVSFLCLIWNCQRSGLALTTKFCNESYGILELKYSGLQFLVTSMPSSFFLLRFGAAAAFFHFPCCCFLLLPRYLLAALLLLLTVLLLLLAVRESVWVVWFVISILVDSISCRSSWIFFKQQLSHLFYLIHWGHIFLNLFLYFF